MDFRQKKIQIAGVVGVLFILALISSVFFKKTEEPKKNPKFEEAAKEMLALAENVRKFYKMKPDYWGLDSKSVISNKIASEKMIKDDKIISNLRYEVLIGQGLDGALAMPGARSFDIVYRNLSFDDCIELASFSFSQEEALGLLSLSIVNDKGQVDFSWGSEYNLPITMKNANKHCDKVNNIMWKYE